jgi:uncharacterized protein (TIGR03032 family)
MSPGFAAFLGASRIGLAVSSYQSGKFYLLGQNVNGGLIVDERFFRKAMGICVADRDTILLATLLQIFRFRNVLDAGQQINNVFDACYVPREAFITGELDTHDVGLLADGRIVFVNTLYNCLATPSERHSFTPLWKPPFISKIVKEDRCHLNGLAMANGVPRYVTAVSKSDTIDGWRDRRTDGGIVIDVATGKVVLGGLSMPHSPRLYGGKLWVLNSGTGELGWVEIGDTAAGSKFHPLAFCPGFLRGLAFHGRHAFVGVVEAALSAFRGTAPRRQARRGGFRALVRGAGHRPRQRRGRALVPHRRAGGGALRLGCNPRRDAGDVPELCQRRDPRPHHPRSARPRIARRRHPAR